MEAQNDYDQNTLDILGKYYDNTTKDIINIDSLKIL
ncbi:hypothetical protein RPO_04890 [Rickettsia rickettsii str. Arizona]|uniref:Uncharacterized protein n=2 Tax=Rickettsia rickettsii TaxID=783 RepID=B0BYB2_RICRO|nr:hypothetical protein A1G_04830 [Rickettsia rickettsii str. 'Sheila Smith']ABY72838.1 hypothetical protein RrIowa_1035 [Rickettsia rickettsii str. Iowa]AFB21967.1 hypothetical protein RPN_02165 [Rickettsia rickettsii str. Brazil]AFB23814.1 hypothetical protein RPL_04885 [Rickettsia rickettsii str. Colombia]AFB25159.1 hypothetical protein RPO_04890 [Rickettsia rickettsii str. Arizona]AFB27839.1 hypothetical protein RPJ_04840 [Rickettsia rickettsii str. Hino]AFB29163.1 hypothetical protein RP